MGWGGPAYNVVESGGTSEVEMKVWFDREPGEANLATCLSC